MRLWGSKVTTCPPLPLPRSQNHGLYLLWESECTTFYDRSTVYDNNLYSKRASCVLNTASTTFYKVCIYSGRHVHTCSCVRTFESAPFPRNCLVYSCIAQCWRLCCITGAESSLNSWNWASKWLLYAFHFRAVSVYDTSHVYMYMNTQTERFRREHNLHALSRIYVSSDVTLCILDRCSCCNVLLNLFGVMRVILCVLLLKCPSRRYYLVYMYMCIWA